MGAGQSCSTQQLTLTWAHGLGQGLGKQQLAQGKGRGTHRDPSISNNMDFPGKGGARPQALELSQSSVQAEGEVG